MRVVLEIDADEKKKLKVFAEDLIWMNSPNTVKLGKKILKALRVKR
jgi:hypothetical protein